MSSMWTNILIVAHVLVKRRCIDPLSEPIDPMAPPQTEAETFADALVGCAPGVLPAVEHEWLASRR